MEPLFFKAENLPWPQLQPIDSTASMEPLFFKAENLRNLFEPLEDIISLQWSRFFSKRKIILRIADTLRRLRFNGAAFFQSGK